MDLVFQLLKRTECTTGVSFDVQLLWVTLITFLLLTPFIHQHLIIRRLE